jgi:hypothetical protein
MSTVQGGLLFVGSCKMSFAVTMIKNKKFQFSLFDGFSNSLSPSSGIKCMLSSSIDMLISVHFG